MKKTIREWLSIHVADHNFYARETVKYLDKLEKENKMYRKWINDLQCKTSELEHRIEHKIFD
jgi:hypothetical protein